VFAATYTECSTTPAYTHRSDTDEAVAQPTTSPETPTATKPLVWQPGGVELLPRWWWLCPEGCLSGSNPRLRNGVHLWPMLTPQGYDHDLCTNLHQFVIRLRPSDPSVQEVPVGSESVSLSHRCWEVSGYLRRVMRVAAEGDGITSFFTPPPQDHRLHRYHISPRG
jgi:hypothetical protein